MKNNDSLKYHLDSASFLSLIKKRTSLGFNKPQCLLVFILVMTAYFICQLSDFNTMLFYFFNDVSNQYIPKIMLAHITEFGDAGIAISIAIFIALFDNNTFKRLLVTILITAIACRIFKEYFYAFRPAAVLDVNSFTIIGDELRQSSFPSGHTVTVFSIATFVSLSFRSNILSVLAFFTASVVGISRVSVGAHWPEDVFFGAALGVFCAWSSALISISPFKKNLSYVTASVLLFLVCIGLENSKSEFLTFPSIIHFRSTLIFVNAMVLGACILQIHFTKKSKSHLNKNLVSVNKVLISE